MVQVILKTESLVRPLSPSDTFISDRWANKELGQWLEKSCDMQLPPVVTRVGWQERATAGKD
jgi:hypothetical protein